MTGKRGGYLGDDEDFYGDEESLGHADHEPRVKDVKRVHHSGAARQQLDSRSEELWLKQQLSDWDDSFESDTPA